MENAEYEMDRYVRIRKTDVRKKRIRQIWQMVLENTEEKREWLKYVKKKEKLAGGMEY